MLHVFSQFFVSFSISYIMQKLQKQVYCYKHVYSFSN